MQAVLFYEKIHLAKAHGRAFITGHQGIKREVTEQPVRHYQYISRMGIGGVQYLGKQGLVEFMGCAQIAIWVIEDGICILEKSKILLYQIIELHVFSGLSLQEVADELKINLRTVNRDLLKARALLARTLGEPTPDATL